jgi:hypothetical protein
MVGICAIAVQVKAEIAKRKYSIPEETSDAGSLLKCTL